MFMTENTFSNKTNNKRSDNSTEVFDCELYLLVADTFGRLKLKIHSTFKSNLVPFEINLSNIC